MPPALYKHSRFAEMVQQFALGRDKSGHKFSIVATLVASFNPFFCYTFGMEDETNNPAEVGWF